MSTAPWSDTPPGTAGELFVPAEWSHVLDCGVKTPPPCQVLPWRVRAWIWLYGFITWPLTVKALKQAGFRRTGWRSWETP